MKRFKNFTFTEKIKWRIRILWLVLLVMIVYMVVLVELGGGEWRFLTDLARNVNKLLFFGGQAYVIYRIYYNKNLLKNRLLLKEQMMLEQDERNQYLHDKSGGVVLDILLVNLLLITCTAAMFSTEAFYTAFAVLVLSVFLKAATYFYYSRA